MLVVEPLELRFPYDLNKKISCSLELTNETNAYKAFNIEMMSPLPYCTEPGKGVVSPRSKCSVNVTLKPHDTSPRDIQHACKFIMRSTKVDELLCSEDLTKDMFIKEDGNVVDEVNVDVVFDA
uniref:MSP domain-containing protein n=1 Tax=Triticum urartu TaxID=4572 RepID=A0A8R7TSE0_TRIUA